MTDVILFYFRRLACSLCVFNPLAVRVYISRVEERINEPNSASKGIARVRPERNREVYRSATSIEGLSTMIHPA